MGRRELSEWDERENNVTLKLVKVMVFPFSQKEEEISSCKNKYALNLLYEKKNTYSARNKLETTSSIK